MVNVMVTVNNDGLIIVSTKANGRTIKLMVKVSLFMQTVNNIKEIGKMTRLMDKARISIQMTPNIKDPGLTT